MAVEYIRGCKTKNKYIEDGFQIVESTDGTVSIFNPNNLPITAHETLSCCQYLGYTFDIENQKCRWASSSSELFKVVLNPQGNDSALFVVEENDECCIDISFDYLFKFNCGDLEDAVTAPTTTTSGGPRPTKTEIQAALHLADLEETLIELESNCETLQIRLDNLSDVPYVIECSDGGAITNLSGDLEMNSTRFYNSSKKQPNFPPNAYGEYASNIITYCLTDDGVTAWENIIINQTGVNGQQNWDTWINSNGSNTSTYNCTNVQTFITTEPSVGLWYTSTCDYSIFDKLQSVEQINVLTTELSNCQTNTTQLEDEIKILTPEVILPDCESYLDAIENFNVSFTLEKLNEETGLLETVYEESLLNIGTGNLYDYIDATSGNTGILIGTDTTVMATASVPAPAGPPRNNGGALALSCFNVRDELVAEVMNEYLVNNEPPTTEEGIAALNAKLTSWYQSCWLQYETTICDPAVIELIQNEKINMSISIKDCCVDFSIMLDRIKLLRNCNKVDNIETYIDEAPKFNLRRVCDNKKSWISNRTKDDRNFELKYRGTEYNTNHHRLVINTKEVDLNLSPARAVEQDVWCYINDNNCILEGCVEPEGIFSAFTCPSGYTMDAGSDSCTSTVITAATDNTGLNVYQIGPGRLNTAVHNQYRGTFFVEDVSNMTWPIYWTITPEETWVGPYYQTDYLTDSSGQYLNHTGFGDKYNDDGSLRWSSPAAFNGVHSEFKSLNYSPVNNKPNPNLLWGGSVISSRLRDAGIYTDPINEISGEWIGYSFCVDIEETKVYRLGWAGDDSVRVKVNGKWLFNTEISPLAIDEVGLPGKMWWKLGGFYGDSGTFMSPWAREIQCYVVVGITLPAGKNIFEVSGIQGLGQETSPVGFVMEIYDATEQELKTINSISVLDSVTIFSTKDTIGSNFNIGEESGYSCPTGFGLDTCVPPPYQCVGTNTIFRSVTQTNCCCEGTPILVKNYGNITLELNLSASTTPIITCNDISTGFTSYTTTELTTLKCGNVYDLGNKVLNGNGEVDTFNGLWFVEENDGTFGVYDVDYISGSTSTYINVSEQMTSECCTIINDGFQNQSDTYSQGINPFKSVSWDPNKGTCVYSKCGDDGCINIDTMLTTELSEIDTVKEFETTLSSELIDVKSRQTISGYPTMRMLYDRYNLHALEYCDIQSSRFDYFDMDNFGQTVGNYWIDLIEQVVPATTIWGSTYTYKNTIFDTQKYAYKRNNTFLCDDPSEFFPWSAITKDSGIDVITETAPQTKLETISGVTTVVEIKLDGDVRNCSTVWSMQHTCDSIFLGRVTTDETAVQEPVPCTLSDITIELSQTGLNTFQAEALYGLPAPTGPVTYQWSDGQTTKIATGLTIGFYNVVVTDTSTTTCTSYAEITITNEKAACWYSLPEQTQHVVNEVITLTGSKEFVQTFTMTEITINSVIIPVNYSESMSATTGTTNINWISSDNDTISGTTTGLTYTNYVDFLNNAFTSAGLYYRAQIATGLTVTTTASGIISGFYIIRPINDTFSLLINNNGGEAFDYLYTENSFDALQWYNSTNVYSNRTADGYEALQCDNIIISDGIVIE